MAMCLQRRRRPIPALPIAPSRKTREEKCPTASSVAFLPGQVPGLASPPPWWGTNLLLVFIPICCIPKDNFKLQIQLGGGMQDDPLAGAPVPWEPS